MLSSFLHPEERKKAFFTPQKGVKKGILCNRFLCIFRFGYKKVPLQEFCPEHSVSGGFVLFDVSATSNKITLTPHFLKGKHYQSTQFAELSTVRPFVIVTSVMSVPFCKIYGGTECMKKGEESHF